MIFWKKEEFFGDVFSAVSAWHSNEDVNEEFRINVLVDWHMESRCGHTVTQ